MIWCARFDEEPHFARRTIDGEEFVFIAQWSPKYTIGYHSNGGSGSMASDVIAYEKLIPIKENAFTAPAGKKFAGWYVKRTQGNDHVNEYYTTNGTWKTGVADAGKYVFQPS